MEPIDIILRNCSAYEIVILVHELHMRGYEQLRLYCGLSPSGMGWRWFLYPKVMMRGGNRFEQHSDYVPFECLMDNKNVEILKDRKENRWHLVHYFF
jgi:hypothetical protein